MGKTEAQKRMALSENRWRRRSSYPTWRLDVGRLFDTKPEIGENKDVGKYDEKILLNKHTWRLGGQ